MLVIDSSIFLAATMPDESSSLAYAILDQVKQNDAIVPNHFHLEVANALTINLRRGRLDLIERAQILAHLDQMPCEVEIPNLLLATMLADQYVLTLYDAAYLEIAQRLSCSLATFDKKLATATATLGLLHPTIASTGLTA
jgi:predicted nucleic acid-binding protein